MENSIEKINKGNAAVTMRSDVIGQAYVKYRSSLMSKNTPCPPMLGRIKAKGGSEIFKI